jgi:Mg2+ and Co2+ transporter CorA
MGWFDNKPNSNKQLSVISKRVKDITEDTRTINESLISINSTNKLLGLVMDKFQNAKFEKQKGRIDSLRLTDEKKNSLYAVIDKHKANALTVMTPLVNEAQELEGNMIAAEVKAKSQLMILEAQRKVISSGRMQLNVLKDIEKEGIANQKEIKQLVHDVKDINGTVKNALLSYNDAQSSINDLLDNTVKPEAEFKNEEGELESIIADFNVE